MYRVYHEEPQAVGGEACESAIVLTLNYLLYCGMHVLGAAYLYAYVLEKDALDNPRYADPALVSAARADNLAATCTACFVMLYAHQACLVSRYTRHAFGVCMLTQLATLMYCRVSLQSLAASGCERRRLLTCRGGKGDFGLDDSAIASAVRAVGYAAAGACGALAVFVPASVAQRRARKQFHFSRVFWKEVATHLVLYTAATVGVFAAPIALGCAAMWGPCGELPAMDPAIGDWGKLRTPLGTHPKQGYGADAKG